MTGKFTTDKASALRRFGCGELLLAFACLFGGAAMAQGPAPTLIQAPQAYSGGTNALFSIPNAVALGDFNGDGLLDFAVVEYAPLLPGSSQVQIFIGNQDGSFTAGNIYTIGTISGQPFATNHNIAVGHFNGPTQPLGIAVAVTQAPGCASGGVVLLYGDGNGAFPTIGCLANPTGVISVAVADYNNDTFDDIAVSNASGAAAGSITVYLNHALINTGAVANSFYNYASYSAVLPGLTGPTLYGTIVAGNINGQNGTSLALLASTGPFTQYVSVFENEMVEQKSVFFLDFVPPQLPLAAPPNGFLDIALADITGTGTAALVGIGTQGLQYSIITMQTGVGNPQLGAFNFVSLGPIGLAMAVADFDGNGIPDLAFLDTNQNLNISLNPGSTTRSHIGPFGPAGQGVAAGFSTGLGKWVLVDAGVFVQLNPLFAQVDETRSVAVYLVDPTTGQPTLAPLYAQSPFLTTGTQRGFAVADFNGVGAPDVAVLGQDESNFAATVSIFQNAYKTATPPGYATPPTVIDLGTLSGQGVGSITSGASAGYALVAGSFRFFDPDIALVTSEGITLLENQGANTTGPFNFTLAPNCQGFFGGSPTPPNNCYLGGDPHYPGLGFSPNSPRPPIIAVDVNGDGYQDVVVAYPENCNAATKSAIYVFLSNHDGTFQAPIYIPSPVVNPVGLAAGNLLGNSVPDLVVTNGGESCSGTQAATGSDTLVGAALIPNTGGGTFGTPKTIFAQPSDLPSPSVSSVAVADMNQDTVPDVVLSATDGIHVLLNTPGNLGTFTDRGAVPLYGTLLGFQDIITNTAQIDIADLNQDGFLDVAAAVGGIVYVFPGDGKGGLSTPVQAFASGPNSNQVRTIDVNGDRSPDVLVNNSLGFSVLLNGSTIGSGVPIAQYELSPSLSFGGITQGTPSTQQVILINTGRSSLQVTNIAFSNNTGNQYSYTLLPCTGAVVVTSNTAMTIPPGASCPFNITFTPNAIGTANAQLLFSDNAPTSNAPNVAGSGSGTFVQTISLTGAGISSQANTLLTVHHTPSPVAVGTPTVEYAITLSNPGPSPATNLNFSHQLEGSVQLQNLSNSQGSCIGAHTMGALATCALGTLQPNSIVTIILDVTPTSSGSLTNPFTFTQDEPDSNPEFVHDDILVLTSLTVTIPTITETINVSDAPSFTDIPVSEKITVSDFVTVTPLLTNFVPAALAFSNSSLGFGNNVGSVQTLTLSNVGSSPVGFSGLLPMSSPGFTVTQAMCTNSASSLPASLPSGGQCVFTITYNGGTTSGTLVFTDTAALSNPPSASAGGGTNFTQTILLSAAGSSSALLNPPSATVNVPTITETIKVGDSSVFPDIQVSEPIKVSDAVSGSVQFAHAQIAVTTPNGTLFNRLKKTATVTVSLKNSTGAHLSGPFLLTFTALPAGVTLLNASGTIHGSSYIVVPTVSGLNAQQTASVTVTFSTPNLTLNFTPVVYSGTF
jgi:uncharacterized repeat protein (TIGR01451 family)